MIIAEGKFESGHFRLELKTETTSRNHIAELLSVGSLDIELDLTPDQAEMDGVRSNYGSLSVMMHLYDSVGADIQLVLFNEFQANLGTRRGIPVSLTITPYGLDEQSFNFMLFDGNVQADDFEQTLSIRLDQFVDERYSMRELFDFVADEHASDLVDFTQKDTDGTDRVFKALHIKEFAKYAMQKVYGTDPEKFAFNWQVESAYFGSIDDTVNSAKFFIVDIDDPEVGEQLTASQDADVGYGAIAYFDDSKTVLGSDESGFGWPSLYGDGSSFETERVRPNSPASAFQTQGIVAGSRLRINNLFLGVVDTVQSETELTLVENAKFSVDTITGTFRLFDPFGEEVTGTFPFPRPFTFSKSESFGATPVLDILTTLAAGSGCLFGSLFSTNYFAQRFFGLESAEMNPTLDEIQEGSLEFIPRAPFVNGIFVSQIGSVADIVVEGEGQNIVPRNGYDNFGTLFPHTYMMPNLRTQRSYAIINQYAERDLVIDMAPAYPFMSKARWNGTAATGYNSFADFGTFPIPEQQLTADAVSSYEKALAEPTAIRMIVFGTSRIKPFQVIRFLDNRIPTKYKIFRYRVTSAKYDFVNDTVEVDAYAIDHIQTQPVTPPPPPAPTPGPPIVPIPQVPGVPLIDIPANNATNIGRRPYFIWNHPLEGGTVENYQVLLSQDGGSFFVAANVGTSITWRPEVSEQLSTGTSYQWRVRAVNSQGANNSAVFSFTTAVAGGDDGTGPGDPDPPQPTRTAPPRRLRAGQFIDPSLGSKRLSDVLAPDGKIRKAVSVEADGADGTLSKRIRAFDATGNISQKVELKSGGEITNSGDDYILDENGLELASSVLAANERSVSWSEELGGDTDFSIFGYRLDPARGGVIQYINTLLFETIAGDAIALFRNVDITFYKNTIFNGSTIQPYTVLPPFSTQRHNYPIGVGTNFTVEFTGTVGEEFITGLAGGSNGRLVRITNRSSGTIRFPNESGSSTAGNRIRTNTGSSVSIAENETVTLIYDGAISRWRIL